MAFSMTAFQTFKETYCIFKLFKLKHRKRVSICHDQDAYQVYKKGKNVEEKNRKMYFSVTNFITKTYLNNDNIFYQLLLLYAKEFMSSETK